MSLREKQRRGIRRELAETGIAMFIERGYEHTTLDAIGEQVHVSPRTLLRYFGSKERLAMDWQYTSLERFAVEFPSGDLAVAVATRWRAYAMHMATLHERTPRMVEQRRLIAGVAVLDLRYLGVLRRYADLLADALWHEAAGTGRPDPTSRMGAAVLLEASEGAVRDWIADDGRGSLTESTGRALDIAIERFLPPS
jgi:AcrR family transcriptional regulator